MTYVPFSAKDMQTLVDRGVALKSRDAIFPVYDDPDCTISRGGYMTASEAGYCERKVFLDKANLRIRMQMNGLAPDQNALIRKHSPKVDMNLDVSHFMFKSWGYAERGNSCEAWVVDIIERYVLPNLPPHVELSHYGEHQRSFTLDNQSGTPDYIVIDRKAKTIASGDIKSVDPRTNFSRLPRREHIAQVTQNTDIVSSYALADGLERGTSQLIYYDASDYARQAGFDVEWDENLASELLLKANKIVDAARRCKQPSDVLDRIADLEPSGQYMDQCKYCSHTEICSDSLTNKRKTMAENAKATGFFK